MIVPGEGPQPAVGMVVGEAPGREEMKVGRPFVGTAGRLLDTVLRALAIPRESLYLTNVVKEIPLDDEERIRRPYSEEIEAWRPILEKEIQNTAPNSILALGATAAFALTQLSGDIPYGSKLGNIYVAWHPAVVVEFDEWLEQIEPWADALIAAGVA